MSYKRLMGVDYGNVRIGISMSDLLQIIASPFETYQTRSESEDLEHIAKLAKDNQVETIVIGLPLNMDGTEGDRAEKTREFGEKLCKCVEAKVVYQDERLSSVTAEDILIESGVRREDRKKVIDKLAATIILRTYMESKK